MHLRNTLCALALAWALACSMLPHAAAAGEENHVTHLDGTFIQPWLYMTYDDAQWDAEMQAMKDTGVQYLIMGDVANHNADGSWTVYYPSELDFLSGYTVYDALEPILFYCDKYDIKLYLGMGLDCAWNSDIASEAGREANRQYMEQCNQITSELYNKYKASYPDTYYGFYFVTELYNTIYMDTDTGIDAYAEGLEEMFTLVLEQCNQLDPSMPLLFSPYVNIFGYGYASINPDRFTEYWTEVLTRIPFRDGDMLCPQDSCGGGGMDPAHLVRWTAAYRDAVDRANAKRGTRLLLGTNAEMFVQPDAARMQSPHGVSYTGIKTVRDFTQRLEIADPYVDALFCFAYPHHYSPYNTLPAFHQCFLEYLKAGTIEPEPPAPPARVDVTLVEREGSRYSQFTFSGMTDNTAVAQTNLYKNGTLYDYIVPSVKVGGNASQNVWVDYDYTEGEQVYEVECVDVCGNVSEKRSFTVDVSNLTQGNTQQLTTEVPIQWNKTSLDYLRYTVTESGVRITGCEKDAEQIEIPAQIEGKPVTVVDWYAFERCAKLRSVVIPDTVTHISRFAFAHCISLETVNLPTSLYAIEQYAFFDCPRLQGLRLPERLTIIEERAFCGCDAITDITIPESCTSVGAYAFLDCDSLYRVGIQGDTQLGLRSFGYRYRSGYQLQPGFVIDSDSPTAISYGKENGIRMQSELVLGDVNGDGQLNVADVVLLQRWLLAVPDTMLADWQAGDLCRDGLLNGADLAAVKAILVQE